MLQVVKIIEGGIDLQSKQQLPRSLVISNGFREIEIPISDAELQKVVELYADKGPVSMSARVQTPAPEEVRRQPQPSPRPPASPRLVQPEPAAAPPSFVEEQDDILDDDGFEPGEEYADRGTGVGSL